MDKIDLSIVIPFYNEEENLSKLHEEVMSVVDSLAIKSEIIYINDGSKDKSLEILSKTLEGAKSKTKVSIISFQRNFGQTAAISAGIDNADGNLISFLDADLQNDPRSIPELLEKMDEGYDAVFGWRRKRKDATLRSLLSTVANKIINLVFSYPYHDVGCSTRIVKSKFLKSLQLYGELHRIMPVLIYLKGAKIGEIEVEHRYRQRGKSKYGFERILKAIIDIITVKFISSYGTKPAYVFGSFGLGSMALGVMALIVTTYQKLFSGVFVHRNPVFLIAIFFGFLGVQFMLMGFLAELQVRTYFESQKKPIYEIRNIEKF